MPSALSKNVDIELLIDMERSQLFEKVISQVQPTSHEALFSTGGEPFSQPLAKADQFRASENAPSVRKMSAGSHLQDEESSYLVLGSYLSENRLERVFKVRHNATEHFYYAFK